MTPRRLRRLPSTTILGSRVPVARGLRARLLGLAHLDRDRAGAGLLIPRCSSVHTFGMRFALDLVFLDSGGREVSVRRGIGRYRIVGDRRASSVLELPSEPGFGAAERFGACRPEKMTPREIQVPPLSLERLRDLLEPDAWRRFATGLARAQELLGERQLWNVNSTAAGGGVAEMLWSWVGLARGLGIGMRWLTIGGDADFFVLTKRLHNYLHGELGDGGELDEAERAVYERVSSENAVGLLERFGPEDVVFLHDPQTAGLIPHLAGSGRTVVWRCHIGADESNDLTAAGWDFLAPYVGQADAVVFSRRAFVPGVVDGMELAIVPPSIDAFSPKNQDMEAAQVRAILVQSGMLAGEPDGSRPSYRRPDGSEAAVERRVELAGARALPDNGTPLVVQVSRWDRLKDPIGVMRGFAAALAGGRDAHLVLAGPSLGSVTDDPDGAAVLAEVEADWERLPEEVRARVTIACLPMEDLDENAAIVNALQRQATIVVQKSLKEGFGLTVTEAMWKARPLVATATGGIADQVEDGVTGLLLRDPLDLRTFGELIGTLLDAPERAGEIGLAAREKVRRSFLEDRHTLQYVVLLERLLG
jgi:trehalose synthase